MTDRIYPPALAPVPADEYRRFVEHHIECETLGTALSEAAKAVIKHFTGRPLTPDCATALTDLNNASEAFDAHQWPEADKPDLADAITRLSALRDAMSAIKYRYPTGAEASLADVIAPEFDLIERSIRHIRAVLGES